MRVRTTNPAFSLSGLWLLKNKIIKKRPKENRCSWVTALIDVPSDLCVCFKRANLYRDTRMTLKHVFVHLFRIHLVSLSRNAYLRCSITTIFRLNDCFNTRAVTVHRNIKEVVEEMLSTLLSSALAPFQNGYHVALSKYSKVLEVMGVSMKVHLHHKWHISRTLFSVQAKATSREWPCFEVRLAVSKRGQEQ